jgi:hypothetical protein
MVNDIPEEHVVVASFRIALEDSPEEVDAPMEVSHERVRPIR